MSLFRGTAEAALYCAHRATTVSSWGLCEQEGHLAAPPLSFTASIERPSSYQMILPSLLTFSSREDGLFGLPLRASNEHLPSVRVARAQEANRPPSHSFSPLTEVPPRWL